MIKELPKLFGRGFAIGFFLPATMCSLMAVSLAVLFEVPGVIATITSHDHLLGFTAAVGFAWLTAILLMAVNRPLYRAYEGYGSLPKKLLGEAEEKRHQRLQDELDRLDEKYRSGEITQEERARRGDLSRRLVQEFPEPQHLLPTRFGNVLRSFESYSRIMYGLDDIPGWLRLAAVVPEEFRKTVDDQKALTDFWVNSRFLITALIPTAAALWGAGESDNMLLILLLVVFGALLTERLLARAATKAAIQWGEVVKAAYDVYLPALRERLRFTTPTDSSEAYEQWRSFSRAVIYRHRDSLPERKLDDEKSDDDRGADDG